MKKMILILMAVMSLVNANTNKDSTRTYECKTQTRENMLDGSMHVVEKEMVLITLYRNMYENYLEVLVSNEKITLYFSHSGENNEVYDNKNKNIYLYLPSSIEDMETSNTSIKVLVDDFSFIVDSCKRL